MGRGQQAAQETAHFLGASGLSGRGCWDRRDPRPPAGRERAAHEEADRAGQRAGSPSLKSQARLARPEERGVGGSAGEGGGLGLDGVHRARRVTGSEWAGGQLGAGALAWVQCYWGSWAGPPGPKAAGPGSVLAVQASGSVGAPAAGPRALSSPLLGAAPEGALPSKCHLEAPLFPIRAPGFPGPGGRSPDLRTLPGWAETWSFSGSGPGGFPPHQGSGSGLEGRCPPTARGDSPSPGRAKGRAPGAAGPSVR